VAELFLFQYQVVEESLWFVGVSILRQSLIKQFIQVLQ